MAPKRKSSDAQHAQTESSKRIKLDSKEKSGVQKPEIDGTSQTEKRARQKEARKQKQPPFKGEVRKLAPPRPFPTVPAAVSATGPKSAHKDGKNLICVSRKTSLGSYLSRCKKILVEEGNDSLFLHAMGAAIPHLSMLAVSLPEILPYERSDIRMEVRTGTVEVMDELIPEDEEEDIGLKTRGKAGLSVHLQVAKQTKAV